MSQNFSFANFSLLYNALWVYAPTFYIGCGLHLAKYSFCYLYLANNFDLAESFLFYFYTARSSDLTLSCYSCLYNSTIQVHMVHTSQNRASRQTFCKIFSCGAKKIKGNIYGVIKYYGNLKIPLHSGTRH